MTKKSSWLNRTYNWVSSKVFGSPSTKEESKDNDADVPPKRSLPQPAKLKPLPVKKATTAKAPRPRAAWNKTLQKRKPLPTVAAAAAKKKAPVVKKAPTSNTVVLNHNGKVQPLALATKKKAPTSATQQKSAAIVTIPPVAAAPVSKNDAKMPPTISSSSPYPYNIFNKEKLLERGVFIFNAGIPWRPVMQNNKECRNYYQGCTYMAHVTLPPTALFCVILGNGHPLFPPMTAFYAIGILVPNTPTTTGMTTTATNNNKQKQKAPPVPVAPIVASFLRIGHLYALHPATRAAMTGVVAGAVLSTARLEEMWRVASGSLLIPSSTTQCCSMVKQDFISQGPIVYHGNHGWSFCQDYKCWVVANPMGGAAAASNSSGGTINKSYICVVGHLLSWSNPSEYALGKIIQYGAHLNLVEFVKFGSIRDLKPYTVSALIGRPPPTPVISTETIRMDLWDTAQRAFPTTTAAAAATANTSGGA